MPNDGATNNVAIGTSAATTVAETGATNTALPQHVPSGDGDGAKNEASGQKGGTQNRDSDVDLKSRIQAVNSGDLRNGAQNEANMDDQKGGTRTDITESDPKNGMQNGKNASDSKSEMQNEGVTHISKAEHISSLEPKLKIDQGTGDSEKVHACSVLVTFGVCKYMIRSIMYDLGSKYDINHNQLDGTKIHMTFMIESPT